VFADVMGVFVARWVNVSLRMVLLLNKVKGRTGEYLKGASSRVALTGCRRAVGSHEGRWTRKEELSLILPSFTSCVYYL